MAIFRNTNSSARREASQRHIRNERNAGSPLSTGGTGLDIEKIVVVTRKTPLQDLVNRLNSKAQAKFYLEQNRVSFTEYERGDAQYQQSLEAIKRQLPRTIKHQFIDRDLLPTYQFGDHDLVVTVGPDGLVVNTAKYLTSQLILAINPDPARIDGVLLPFSFEEMGVWIERVLRGDYASYQAAMAKATLNDGQTLYALNDLFIGARTHISARYHLEYSGSSEPQSSSGMIVSTATGCTGWLSSVITGAWQTAHYFDVDMGDLPNVASERTRSDERLWFAVREPFTSKTSRATIVFGILEPGQELTITSQMPDQGVIFSDGIESDYLSFNSGFIARVGLAERHANLISRD
ncbi:MAG TPA: sugar kinase [Ktedonobacterales bacterium]|nr:sugar kinase [Ktedonobacterales bacterium]